MNTMTKRSLASLVIKLMAVYILITFIRALPYVLGAFQMGIMSRGILAALAGIGASLLFPAIWCAAGFVLITLADPIAAKLIPEDEKIEALPTASGETILRIVLVCMGVFILIQVLPQLMQTLVSSIYLTRASFGQAAGSLGRHVIGKLISSGIQIVCGLILIRNPKLVAGWINWQD